MTEEQTMRYSSTEAIAIYETGRIAISVVQNTVYKEVE